MFSFKINFGKSAVASDSLILGAFTKDRNFLNLKDFTKADFTENLKDKQILKFLYYER